jgi:hypothetical protein
MVTTAVCEICGADLTMWNRAGWPNKRPICTRCYRGSTPEALKQEAQLFATSHPSATREQILRYGWGEALHIAFLHTVAFLATVWIGAWFGGFILAMILSFVPMFFITRADNSIDNFIDKKRVQMHDGIMMATFWLIFWVNYFRVMFQFLGGDYASSNVLLEIWLVPTIASPLFGLLVAWLTDRGRLERLADAFGRLKGAKA